MNNRIPISVLLTLSPVQTMNSGCIIWMPTDPVNETIGTLCYFAPQEVSIARVGSRAAGLEEAWPVKESTQRRRDPTLLPENSIS